MKSWTIRKRIVLGFAVILTLVATLAVTSFIVLRQVKAEAEFLDTKTVPNLSSMSQIKGMVAEIQIKLLRNLLARTPEDRKKYEDEITAMRADILQLMADYKKNIVTVEDQALYAKIEQARDQYVLVRSKLFELTRADKKDEAYAFTVSTVRPAYEGYLSLVEQALQAEMHNATLSTSTTRLAVSRANTVVMSFSAAAIALGALFAAVIVLGLNRVLARVSSTLNEGASQVASASGQVSSASQTLAEGSSEQAASLEETSSSLEELASMTKRNADSAGSAKNLSGETRVAAEAGNNDMAEMRQAMDAIKTSSSDIAKIIKTIDEIAFQTNILALNAAVEAARAGEAGAGFAVVADEVRALAQRSANSAKETASKIEVAIQNGNQGASISEKVARSLAVIVEKARKVDELVAEIATASNEQNQGISQINTAVSQMDKVTQSNAASAEETAAAAEELNAQSAVLMETVQELQQLVSGAGTATRSAAVTAAPVMLRPVIARQAAAPAAKMLFKKELPLPAAVTVGQHDDFFKNS